MDLAWSVEAFLHAPNPGAYFQGVSRLLRPGGRLIVCDDFLARPRAAPAGSLTLLPSSSETQWIAALQDGWHAPGLLSLEEAGALARGCGLHLARSLDLTPHLRLRALPDPLAQVLLWLGQRLPLRHPILPSMLGSLALQQCLRNGWIQYCFVVFEKVG
jgi:SAM-dependent methyltransferase